MQVSVLFFMCLYFTLCWSLNDEGDVIVLFFIFLCCLFGEPENEGNCLGFAGVALLRFRERVVKDPFGALSNWNDDDGEVDPCSWFGVGCSGGKVVQL